MTSPADFAGTAASLPQFYYEAAQQHAAQYFPGTAAAAQFSAMAANSGNSNDVSQISGRSIVEGWSRLSQQSVQMPLSQLSCT